MFKYERMARYEAAHKHAPDCVNYVSYANYNAHWRPGETSNPTQGGAIPAGFVRWHILVDDQRAYLDTPIDANVLADALNMVCRDYTDAYQRGVKMLDIRMIIDGCPCVFYAARGDAGLLDFCRVMSMYLCALASCGRKGDAQLLDFRSAIHAADDVLRAGVKVMCTFIPAI